MSLKGNFLLTIFISLLIISIAIANPAPLQNFPKSEPQISDTTLHSIEGKVLDDKGEPIPGAFVRIDGTFMGVASDIIGRFKISNLPSGQYDISAIAVGYNKSSPYSIVLPSNFSSSINIRLVSEAIVIETLWVIPRPYIVDKYLTSNIWEIDQFDLDESTARTISQALKACPGLTR